MYETAFFLFSLGVFGNFVGDTIGCQLQKAFSHTVFHKYMIVFAMIYFTLNFTNKTVQSPLTHLKDSSLLFLFFILINRMSYSFSMIALGLLAVQYILSQQIDYLHSLHADKKEIEMYEKISEWLTYGLTGMILLGFSLYFAKQKREHKNFSLATFFFGTTKCDHV